MLDLDGTHYAQAANASNLKSAITNLVAAAHVPAPTHTAHNQDNNQNSDSNTTSHVVMPPSQLPTSNLSGKCNVAFYSICFSLIFGNLYFIPTQGSLNNSSSDREDYDPLIHRYQYNKRRWTKILHRKRTTDPDIHKKGSLPHPKIQSLISSVHGRNVSQMSNHSFSLTKKAPAMGPHLIRITEW